MTDRYHFSRREINALIAGGISLPLCGAAIFPVSAQGLSDGQHLLLSVFADPRNACQIGEYCLDALTVDGGSVNQLTDTILGSIEGDVKRPKSKDRVRRDLSNRVHDDFAEGKLVNVAGWMLALTEARLYALAAITMKAEPQLG
jgi:hypothetical protein